MADVGIIALRRYKNSAKREEGLDEKMQFGCDFLSQIQNYKIFV